MFKNRTARGFIFGLAFFLVFSCFAFGLSKDFEGNKKVDGKIFQEIEQEIARIIPLKGEKAYEETLVRVVVHLADEDEPLLKDVGMGMISMVEENVARKQKEFLYKTDESDFRLATTISLQYSVAGYISYNGLQKLASMPEVKAIDFDNLNVPFTTQGRQLMNIDWVASNLGFTGSGIAVGVIDSAFDYKHAEFGGYSTYPNNIVVDGYNFSNNSSNIYPASWDDGYHGTGTAAIVRRVAPGAKLVLATVFPNAYDSVIANAINFMAQKQSQYNIRVINMSLGGGAYTSVCSNTTIGGAINNAVTAGIIPVAASGNDGYTSKISMPACLSNVISVGSVFDVNNANYSPFPPAYCSQSVRRQDERICYSNAASILDIYAPSEEVITAQVFGGTFALGGTSSASPYAAGAIAVLLEAVPSLRGDVNGVRQVLASTGATVIGDLGYGQKRIDVKSAIENSGGGTSGCQGTEQEFASADVPRSIPDNNTAGVNSALYIPTGGTISALRITMNISHTYRGDLKLKLKSPSGTEILFYDPASNDSADNIVGYMDLTGFNGQSMTGTWTFNVSDHAAQDTGTINSWSLTICYDPVQTNPPVINSFYASPGTITEGSSTRLYWTTSNTTSVEVVGVGTYSSSSGNVLVTPASSRSYTLTATGPGGQVQATASVTVESSGSGCTPQSFSFSSSDVPKSIPDYNTGGVNSYLTVPANITDISNFTVTVNISHTYKGDLIVKLYSPSGKEFLIHNRAGGSADNVIGTFSTTVFNGDNASGQWRLFASDNARYDTGTINSWKIDFSACGESSSPPPEGDLFQSGDTPLNIPDYSTTGVTSTINVSRATASYTVTINVNITHTYIGDLIVTLITPAGNVVLHNREGGSADNIVKSYQVNYNGNNPYGQWKLKVEDRARYDTGKLNSWSVQF